MTTLLNSVPIVSVPCRFKDIRPNRMSHILYVRVTGKVRLHSSGLRDYDMFEIFLSEDDRRTLDQTSPYLWVSRNHFHDFQPDFV